MSEMLSNAHLVYSYPVGRMDPGLALTCAIDLFNDRFQDQPLKLIVALGFPLSRTPAGIPVENNDRLRLGEIWMPLGAHAEEYSR